MGAPFKKQLIWRIEAWAHTAVAALVGSLPPQSVFHFGEAVGKMIWPFMKARQVTIARNLRIAGVVSEEICIEDYARQNFVRTTANLVSSSVAVKLPPEDLDEIIEVENPEVLEKAAAEGRGVILLLAHMGNWELLTRLHRFFPNGTKSGAFYRPLNNLVLNERVLREREADGTRLFSKRDSLHIVSGFLRENGIIGILADQRVGMQGEVVSFFGRLTRASPLPSLLARRCKCEVVSLSLRTVAPGKWSVRYHEVQKPYHSANCMEALECAMKVSPIDVFWLQERWKLYLPLKGGFGTWLKKQDARGLKPHRGLVWRKVGEGDLQLHPDYIHGDIEYEEVIGGKAEELREINLAKPLPIDFIALFSEDLGLADTARQLGIPILRAGISLK